MNQINLADSPGRAWRHVALVGMMGAGKTTVGKRLGVELGWQYVDSDEAILARSGFTVPELFAERGEAGFRQEETDSFARVLSGASPTVFATGGGCVESKLNIELLEMHAITVYLRATVDTLLQRVGNGDGRPLLKDDPRGKLFEILGRRANSYSTTADLTVDVDDRSVEGIVSEIAAWVRSQPWFERAIQL